MNTSSCRWLLTSPIELGALDLPAAIPRQRSVAMYCFMCCVGGATYVSEKVGGVSKNAEVLPRTGSRYRKFSLSKVVF